MRGSNSLQNFHFWVNYPFKMSVPTDIAIGTVDNTKWFQQPFTLHLHLFISFGMRPPPEVV